MKEKIVIKDEFWVKHLQEREKDFYEEDLCSGGNPEEWWHYVKEQVPESWEELKELCKDLKGLYKNYNIEVFDDAIFVLDAKAVLLKVYDDGEIKDSGSEVIAENRTPQQMWQIIKSLIGEE